MTCVMADFCHAARLDRAVHQPGWCGRRRSQSQKLRRGYLALIVPDLIWPLTRTTVADRPGRNPARLTALPLVLDTSSMTTSQPTGTISTTDPEVAWACTVSSRCRHSAPVKSSLMVPDVHSVCGQARSSSRCA